MESELGCIYEIADFMGFDRINIFLSSHFMILEGGGYNLIYKGSELTSPPSTPFFITRPAVFCISHDRRLHIYPYLDWTIFV